MNTNTIRIEKIINGGYGLARLDNGRIILLRGGLPGEEVTFQITEKKRNFDKGKATRIIESHTARIKPPCPYYDQCGGCNLQHCLYDEQLAIKDHILRELLEQHIDLQNLDDVQVAPCLRSPQETGYRQRIRLQFDSHHQPGFLRFHSHEVIPVTTCLVARPELNGVLQDLQSHTTFSQLASHCRELELLLNPVNSHVNALLHFSRKPRPADIGAARQLVEEVDLLEGIFFKGTDFSLIDPLVGKGISQGTKKLSLHLDMPKYHQQPLILSWEIGGFCQVNLEQNHRLVQRVLSLCQFEGGETVLDLFCGMGNFSIPLALRTKEIVGVEGQGSSIRSANENSKKVGLENTSFIKHAVHTYCQKLADEDIRFDWVIMDPPRQGVPGLASTLARITRKKMVYISCDPATLCRDLGNLTREGFSIRAIYPIDMFPQTHHIETVALLEKN